MISASSCHLVSTFSKCFVEQSAAPYISSGFFPGLIVVAVVLLVVRVAWRKHKRKRPGK